MRLVLASNNGKKLLELQTLFAPLGLEMVNQGALGIAEADEPHPTFVENALAKARHAALHARCAAIADDSGLCVDALDGAPGVLSARYATLFGQGKSDAANNRMLLQKMQGVSERRARFVSALVAVRSADDPEPLVAMGRWHGEIGHAPVGDGGFGYDPLMFISALGRTVAELSADVKNAHSHRAIASQQMLAAMREEWRLG
ncbi:RdgB/HAM1 family non-canonical purine NTP pyrophosphatase [Piscinibacter sp.]|uniref:RdgB/HAM1 family non-canonical purine NTP pyrophosphatase n=1 Tax=Piscinibacter sp. TaxID=1903157 RepID=UPI002CCD00B1|nr:RdgB/HAM1 family non-canonical purine NTP pyrophosphatase [Albitalea sp.]HUG21732.1 RdgB/HAM1 family non-canonical purine NTP pyrophosphatase [Albitalea sp.]